MEVDLAWNQAFLKAPFHQLGALYPPADQLEQGHGIYLVFWFGPHASTGRSVSAAPNGDVPSSASDLKALLKEQCIGGFKDRLSVVVVDVSRAVPTGVGGV